MIYLWKSLLIIKIELKKYCINKYASNNVFFEF